MKNYTYKGIKLASNAEIAKELGLSEHTIRQWRNKDKVFLIRLGLTYKKLIDSTLPKIIGDKSIYS